ncbi:sigma-70 family RNA polymerase sigma factor [Peptococcus simiae]|uniref:sigma-70 family RNA polymerase sigma factor n=1 Tax=Peptococcus simiae TaxID=1643805 RepID=UPI00397EF74B
MANKRKDIEKLVHDYKANPSDEKLEEIIENMEPLVRYWCQAQCYLPWEKEDMLQVARIAVLGALDRFDPEKGVRFKTFAYRTVSGKLMNYYRDNTWRITIPRKYREMSTYITKAENEYYQNHGESPSTGQIAKMIGVEEQEVADAIEAKRATQTTSLSVQEDADGNVNTLANYLGEEDGNLDTVELKRDLKEAMEHLDMQERQVIYYRYVEDLTQTKIADILGVSQMQVSRLEKNSLNKIRQFMKSEAQV